MHLFIHFEATRGAEPFLTYLEFEMGFWVNKGTLIRHDVSLPAPSGFTERQVATMGVEISGVIPWLVWATKRTRTVIVYDKDMFLRVMDAEIMRLGKGDWYRPGIEIVDLADKATPLAKIEHGDGFRKPSFEEACLNILMENANGLESVKRLWEHKEIQQLCEVA